MASPDGAAPGPSDEQLARVVVRVLAALIALLLAGGVASAAGRLAEGDTSDETADDVLVGSGALSPRGGVGPLAGTAVPTYVRSRAAALADVAGGERRAAVVSFDAYRTPDEAREAVAGLDARSLLLALPGGRPLEVAVDVDLAGIVARQRDEAAAEKAALEQLLPTVTDESFKQQYQADIERLGALLQAPRQAGPVVHAVLVVGTGDALRRTAKVPGVRLVDVGRDAELPGVGEAAGLRPEETDRAGVPPTRPS